jgi:hypothetical protein
MYALAHFGRAWMTQLNTTTVQVRRHLLVATPCWIHGCAAAWGRAKGPLCDNMALHWRSARILGGPTPRCCFVVHTAYTTP